jgi:hypothetical protein
MLIASFIFLYKRELTIKNKFKKKKNLKKISSVYFRWRKKKSILLLEDCVI